MKDVRIIIAGGRDFSDYELLKQNVDPAIKKFQERDVTIISGTARGADRLGEQYAAEHHLPLRLFPADWDTYGKAAGPIRNKEMAEYASKGDTGILIACWDGQSRGTDNMIQTARKAGLEVHIVNY